MRSRTAANLVAAALIILAAANCSGPPAIERLAEARRVASELLTQFTSASDATNRIVMASGEGVAAGFVQRSGQATTAVQQNTETLKSLLVSLRLVEETQLLAEFVRRFHEFQVLDRRIQGLALENTNVKAQQLAFGVAHEAANAFQGALSAEKGSGAANGAIAAVREIQVLQAQHIPEDDDGVMTRFEQQMTAAESVARQSLRALATTQRDLTDATKALDRFMSLNAEIVKLSRRNSNVQSLALSLGEKGTLAARCEDGLRALQAALAKRGFSGTR